MPLAKRQRRHAVCGHSSDGGALGEQQRDDASGMAVDPFGSTLGG